MNKLFFLILLLVFGSCTHIAPEDRINSMCPIEIAKPHACTIVGVKYENNTYVYQTIVNNNMLPFVGLDSTHTELASAILNLASVPLADKLEANRSLLQLSLAKKIPITIEIYFEGKDMIRQIPLNENMVKMKFEKGMATRAEDVNVLLKGFNRLAPLQLAEGLRLDSACLQSRTKGPECDVIACFTFSNWDNVKNQEEWRRYIINGSKDDALGQFFTSLSNQLLGSTIYRFITPEKTDTIDVKLPSFSSLDFLN